MSVGAVGGLGGTEPCFVGERWFGDEQCALGPSRHDRERRRHYRSRSRARSSGLREDRDRYGKTRDEKRGHDYSRGARERTSTRDRLYRSVGRSPARHAGTHRNRYEDEADRRRRHRHRSPSRTRSHHRFGAKPYTGERRDDIPDGVYAMARRRKDETSS
jgi:hypothetical protein